MSTLSPRTLLRQVEIEASADRAASPWPWPSALKGAGFLVGLLLLMAAGSPAWVPLTGMARLQVSQPVSLLLLGGGLLCIAMAIRRRA
jgi:hypothetical protein